MDNQYDAIVIGSGMGGCAAALLMAHKGKKVLMLEKNAIQGGRLSSFEKNGFFMDLGVHIISCGSKGSVAECLDRVGAKDAVEFVGVRPIMAINGELFKFPHDVKKMVPEDDFNAMMKYIMDVRSYDEEKIASVDDITLEEHLGQYTKHPLVHSFMNQIAGVYCVIDIDEVAAGEFIRCFNRESAAHASGYPVGGCIAITNAYISEFEKLGGEFKLSASVSKILVEEGKAVGVVANDVEYRADMIVSNAGLKETVIDIMNGEGFDASYVDRINNLVYSTGVSVMRLALDAPLTDIKMYSNTTDEDYKVRRQRIANGDVPEKVGAMLVVPSNFSSGIAPEGKQYVCAGTGVPRNTSEEVADRIIESMYRTTQEYIPGLDEHLMFKSTMTPHQLAKMVGKEGSVIGLAQIPGQVSTARPSIKAPNIDNLYFVGCETGAKGGVGIEFAANSAMEFFDTYVD